jgi:pimeloyl-ACP methyl ester carboxylesterase
MTSVTTKKGEVTLTLDEFRTKDDVRLVYEVGKGDPATTTSSSPVVLVHGWSGSRRYFDDSFAALLNAPSPPPRVVRYDLRGHGDSDKPEWGYHVARYAADLKEFLEHLDLTDVTVVGTSMGCAIIWSYLELYGAERLKGAVCVDQAPLQNRAPDWNLGSKGCYDVASLTRLQELLKHDFEGFARGNAECCLSNEIDEEYEALLIAETLKASPTGLAALMADHTALDWRPTLRRTTLPMVVMAGAKSQIFPAEGVAHVGKLAANAVVVTYPTSDHWLYIEHWQKFADQVCDFAANGRLSRNFLGGMQQAVTVVRD